MKKEVNADLFSLSKISMVIRFLVISDFFIWGSWGLIYPIFAIYITDNIQGGGLAVAGIAYGIFVFTRSLFQIPIAIFADKTKGEKDDFWFMLSGTCLLILTPILMIYIDHIWQLYAVQVIHGLGNAAIYPTRMAIFTRHIDKKHEGLEWGIFQTMMDISLAFSAFLGGFIVSSFGWNTLLITRSVLYFLGALFVLGIYRQMKKGKILFAR
ncbi:MFS transporter [Candidatus Falkowbacteria bacterium]|nr:MFS transporter [Candidatus Falkowbacteria bacterium]